MTRYAIDVQRSELHAVWSTGLADATHVVAVLPSGISAHDVGALAAALTGLSAALWRRYTHPSMDTHLDEGSSAGWQRCETRALFGDVTSTVRDPNLPIDDVLIVSYDLVEENAHRVGRALHTIDTKAVTDAVVGDIEFELAAVADAEAGSLVGRAQQAISLIRPDASPVQVAAADRLLHRSLLNPDELLQSIDPTSAAVAAAHWLHAAAEVVAEHLGVPPAAVIQEADTIEATPQQTPITVLELLDRQISPLNVVATLIQDAMLVAEGLLPKTAPAIQNIRKAQRRAASAPARQVRLTLLDPQRPSRDLLEDLLAGIRGCWLVYPRYVDYNDLSDVDGSEIDDMFVAAVRARASQRQGRLTDQ
ncbi:hypothetical protein [Dactylosporangium sp. NPDC005555]|uniref:hypothetical protein n=1 Tax=Dactylosporangium sp. NPDC005555 TaxID=3154889 RepID=UPI0033A3546C